jgi:hypothetical protein
LAAVVPDTRGTDRSEVIAEQVVADGLVSAPACSRELVPILNFATRQTTKRTFMGRFHDRTLLKQRQDVGKGCLAERKRGFKSDHFGERAKIFLERQFFCSKSVAQLQRIRTNTSYRHLHGGLLSGRHMSDSEFRVERFLHLLVGTTLIRTELTRTDFDFLFVAKRRVALEWRHVF